MVLRRLEGREDIHFGSGRGCGEESFCGLWTFGRGAEGGTVGEEGGGDDEVRYSRSEAQCLHTGGCESVMPLGLLVHGGGGRGTCVFVRQRRLLAVPFRRYLPDFLPSPFIFSPPFKHTASKILAFRRKEASDIPDRTNIRDTPNATNTIHTQPSLPFSQPTLHSSSRSTNHIFEPSILCKTQSTMKITKPSSYNTGARTRICAVRNRRRRERKERCEGS